MSEQKEGWVNIDGAAKWHYVREDGRSLCGKWAYLGRAAPDLSDPAHPENCAACRKALAKAKP